MNRSTRPSTPSRGGRVWLAIVVTYFSAGVAGYVLLNDPKGWAQAAVAAATFVTLICAIFAIKADGSPISQVGPRTLIVGASAAVLGALAPVLLPLWITVKPEWVPIAALALTGLSVIVTVVARPRRPA